MNSAAVIGWALQTGFTVSVLIGLVLIMRRPFAKYFGAGAAYALWAIPVLRVFMPTITVPWVMIPWANTPLTDAAAIIAPGSDANLHANITTDAVSATPSLDLWPFLAAAWVIGAVIWFAYQIKQHRNMVLSLHRDGQLVPDNLYPIIKKSAVSLGLKRVPEIRLSREGLGPLVTGIVRPIVILPTNFTDSFTSEQQHYALVHEFAHIKRHDLWASFAALIFRAINWPNPLVHYAAHKFRADQEAACDAAVLHSMGGDKSITHGYAATLVHAAKTSTMGRAISPLGLTIHEPIKERLMTLKTYKSRTGMLPKLAAATTIIAASAIAAPLTMATDHPEEQTLEVDTKTKGKRVIKLSRKDDNGNETSKHYEVITEDGESKAWEIDAFGNKTEVQIGSIEQLQGLEGLKHLEHLKGLEGLAKLKILSFGDGETMTFSGNGGKGLVLENFTKEGRFAFGEDTEFPKNLMGEDNKLIIKRLMDGNSSKVFSFSSDDDMEITSDSRRFSFGEGGQTKSLVMAAESMLSNADTNDLSSNAKRKLEKAQRALKEAKEALEAEK